MECENLAIWICLDIFKDDMSYGMLYSRLFLFTRCIERFHWCLLIPQTQRTVISVMIRMEYRTSIFKVH